ncbi:MAG TPA: mechanosensitive ion channel family protein [Tepidisphaeraceae bacterium]|jgi:small-conductance mechanosensitive channel|nr:mechanosensitive ion channel family protein [Tepidisphaeraceae bacterium]
MPEKLKSVITRRFLFGRILLIATIFLLAMPAIAAAPANSDEQVLHYLNHTIEWHGRVSSLDQGSVSSNEILFRDTIRQNADQVLHLAFAAARGQAAYLASGKTATTAPSGDASKLAQGAAKATQRVTEIQTQLDQINQQIKDATQPSPDVLSARRDMLVSELNLAKARQGVLQDLVGFTNSNGASGDLLQKIDELERSAPAAQSGAQPASTAKPASTASTENYRPESGGILSLVTEMFTLTGRLKEISTLTDQTADLQKQAESLRAPIHAELLDAIHRADALSQNKDSDDPKALEAQGHEFDALSARFNLITAADIPLRKQITFLGSTQGNLKQWRTTVDRTYGRVIRALLIRLGAIAIAILVLLGISALWRRATFRYVNDARRRRQFLLIRRLVVGALIIVIIVGGVVTEFSSLMTFAGLITAGIAVALQTVILSGVAHFFFMGRYGVRVGDRVTIAGVTGDVIDIGIFRLYLMELGGDGKDTNPTGRIVVFSNAVLFQPSAFFKQLPGTDYVWHEVALTLAPDTNHQLAETKLLGAVQSVYAKYSDVIQKQYEVLKDTVHFQIPAPQPKGRFRFVDEGLEFVVRYPVEVRQGEEIDDQVTRQLLDAIQKEPNLRLVASGTPKIQPAA